MGGHLGASSPARELEPAARPRIGISACLLGDEVRFDGGHKRDSFLTDVLAPHVDWVRVCPEVEAGMGTPRETLRLVRDTQGAIRMLTTRTGIDHTASMAAWSRDRLERLASEHLSGYVLKKDSPSCGMEHVKVFGPDEIPERAGRGIFAEALLARFPNLPIEDEGRLGDARLRENFVERVFAYRRIQTFFDGNWTAPALARFHAAHEMSLLTHSSTAYRQLAELIADGAGLGRDRLRRGYEDQFLQTFRILPTRARHLRAMLAMAGRLRNCVSAAAMSELRARVDDYRRDRAPLIVPLTLLRDHVRAHGVAALAGQTYLERFPYELRLCHGG
jgi:uncharacterized protein YbbK (DUF523 family)/uncharacterized protein YbgA (DUF1722 family)